MPNDCWNNLTIASHDNPTQLINLMENEFIGKKIEKIHTQGKQGVKLLLWSAWKPDFKWLKSLVEKYPECWIKNEWNEEGGKAGVWVGGSLYKGNPSKIQSLEWDDICIEGENLYFN